MVSSVVRIQKGQERVYESEEEEEEEEDYGMQSRVSLPPKPERKSVSPVTSLCFLLFYIQLYIMMNI